MLYFLLDRVPPALCLLLDVRVLRLKITARHVWRNVSCLFMPLELCVVELGSLPDAMVDTRHHSLNSVWCDRSLCREYDGGAC